MLWGYFKAMFTFKPRYNDLEFRKFLRQFQWRSLLQGKNKTAKWLHDQRATLWDPGRKVELPSR
jgi:hypothetical protein